MGKALTNLAAVGVNPRKPNDVYTSSADGVISKTTDGGMI